MENANKNTDIRIMVADEGVQYKDIAAAMGITKEYLCRLMSKPLTDSMKIRIINGIYMAEAVKNSKKIDWCNIPVEYMTKGQLRQAVKDLSAELEQIRREL